MGRRLLMVLVVLLIGAPALRAEDRFFDSAGVRIHYLDVGKGEPVVLIHGFTLNGTLQWFFPGIAQALARDYRVLTLDCRGHGLSGKPHDPRCYGPEMAEDVLRLLDHLGLRKAHVVGYSMGGFIALYLLANHPERLLTLTTGGAGAPRSREVVFIKRLADEFDQGRGMGLLLARLTPRDQAPPNEDQIRTANRLMRAFNDPKALAAALRSLPALAVPVGQLNHNKVPVLALIGEFDPLKDGVDAMRGRVDELTIVVIHGADHMNAFDQPPFLSSLRAFLAQRRPAADTRRTEPSPEPCCGPHR